MPLRSLAVCLAGVLAIGLAACGNSLDTASATPELEQQLKAQGLPVKSLECPDSVENEPGRKFECTLTLDGGQAAEVPMVVAENERINTDGDAFNEAVRQLVTEAGLDEVDPTGAAEDAQGAAEDALGSE